MKKSAFSSLHRHGLGIFLKYLADAGWDIGACDDILNAQDDIDPMAKAHFVGSLFDLYLEYHIREFFLVFEMSKHDGELVLCLQLHPSRDTTSQLLEQIIKKQDTLDSDNYPDFVKLLIPLCDLLLVKTDEGFYRL